VAPLYRLR